MLGRMCPALWVTKREVVAIEMAVSLVLVLVLVLVVGAVEVETQAGLSRKVHRTSFVGRA